MHRRAVSLSISIAVVLGAIGAGAVGAAGPVRTSDAYTDRIFDDFIYDLCGIETYTTVIERWTRKDFPDGSSMLHVTRTFIPDDERIPIEKGAGSSYFAPDGSQTVRGAPAILFEPGGGIRLIAAGRAVFDPDGNLVLIRGVGDYLGADMVELYCPA